MCHPSLVWLVEAPERLERMTDHRESLVQVVTE